MHETEKVGIVKFQSSSHKVHGRYVTSIASLIKMSDTSIHPLIYLLIHMYFFLENAYKQ